MMSGLLISIVQTEEDGKGQKNEGCRTGGGPCTRSYTVGTQAQEMTLFTCV